MIRVHLSGVRWGTDAVQDTDQETGEIVEGRQLNLHDPDSNQLFHVGFFGVHLAKLVEERAGGLTVEQRRELAPIFTGGVILPNGSGPQA